MATVGEQPAARHRQYQLSYEPPAFASSGEQGKGGEHIGDGSHGKGEHVIAPRTIEWPEHGWPEDRRAPTDATQSSTSMRGVG